MTKVGEIESPEGNSRERGREIEVEEHFKEIMRMGMIREFERKKDFNSIFEWIAAN